MKGLSWALSVPVQDRNHSKLISSSMRPAGPVSNGYMGEQYSHGLLVQATLVKSNVKQNSSVADRIWPNDDHDGGSHDGVACESCSSMASDAAVHGWLIHGREKKNKRRDGSSVDQDPYQPLHLVHHRTNSEASKINYYQQRLISSPASSSAYGLSLRTYMLLHTLSTLEPTPLCKLK
ncbi:hypothetical protein NL676_004201 [Syzygium grande]|nr:hypothetical protein NL676_004201 [Syzygium grande]